MKLITKTETYKSPQPHQGSFEGAFIEDFSITSIRGRNRLEVTFALCYLNEKGIKTVLDTATLAFFGNENEAFSSNKTTWFQYPNPNYDPQAEGSEEYLHEKLMDYLAVHEGIFPEGYTITNYGYPTLEKALQYFTGGTLAQPEVFLEAELAKGWLLNTLSLNGEIVGRQFQFEV
ncbi:MAG TPA: hypothetical protein VFM70_05900 [Salinimicrobium sp.]|nr:hypothetical protein [Salinimicrobium sp.]